MKKFIKYFILVSILCYIGMTNISANSLAESAIPEAVGDMYGLAQNAIQNVTQITGNSSDEIQIPQVSSQNLSTEVCGVSDIPASLPIFVSNIVNLLKILVPIILVIMGMIDFVRATISSDEKQMKESQSRFIRRTLAAVVVFFVIAVVQFVFSTISTNNKMTGCLNCFVNGKCTSVIVSDSYCYVCTSNSNLKLWTGTNPGKTENCANGYAKHTDISHEDCGIKACYQCNGNLSIYKWAINSDDDEACRSGYHSLNDITSEESCNSSANNTSNSSQNSTINDNIASDNNESTSTSNSNNISNNRQKCRKEALEFCRNNCYNIIGDYTSQAFMECANDCTSKRYSLCE